MSQTLSKRNIAFIVPTLGEQAAQNEDVVQLLLFAALRLEKECGKKSGSPIAATIISVQHDRSGWKHLSSLFTDAVLQCVSIEDLDEPATPNLAIASHKPAYNLFEFMKNHSFDEVHCLDRCGLAYYLTQAKHLGLYFLDTLFAVHVIGGVIFQNEVQDKLLDNIGALMDDILERGSLERADIVYVHDRMAWEWYADKIEVPKDARVLDLSRAEIPAPVYQVEETDRNRIGAIVYYGPLSAEGGIQLFCDAIGKALTSIDRPVEVCFVGSPQAIGGMDAVSYIRLRSAHWNVPVTIKRDLTIADEIDFLFDLTGIIVSNTVRCEGLRARLIEGSGLQVLHVKQTPGKDQKQGSVVCPPNPGRIAHEMVTVLSALKVVRSPQQPPHLTELWCREPKGIVSPDNNTPPSLPLKLVESGPKVSVCVIHYSRPEKLRTALSSLKRQTYRNFEVIVVDDGSPEPKVQDELKKISQEIGPLGWRLLVQENRYLGAARNYAASQAAGDYLVFMDDDNVAKPNEISMLVAVALRTGAEIITSFYDVFENESTLESNAPAPVRFTPFGSDSALGAFSNCFGDANALYSRKVFERLGGFTEDFGITHEDWELFCRASLEGVKMLCVPEPLFWYRMDNNGMFRGENTQMHKSANLRRHIRPYLQNLPYYQAKLVQLAQGLTEELPLTTVSSDTQAAGPKTLRNRYEVLPYARVAVIVRTKDRPLLLKRALRSVLDQTYRDWLLVIVNDGGDPENVRFVLDEVKEELTGRVFVLNNPVSLGMQSASNAGINNCDSDFIIIHDDDDTWSPTFLARAVSHLDGNGWNPKLGGVITWSQVIVEEICDDEIKVHNRFIFNDKLETVSLIDLAVENRFPPISFLFRRAVLDAVGPFEQQAGPLGDWEFHLRVLKTYNIDVIPEPLANYHHRTQSTEGDYGNSVHAQSGLHRSKRVELHNTILRKELNNGNGLTFAQLLAMGEFQKSLQEKQEREFQRLHDYIWTLEQRIKFISSQYEQQPSPGLRPDRNLACNGDFRHWQGPEKAMKGPDGTYVYSLIHPGFFIIYDERCGFYRTEHRKWTEDGQRLPFGKTYFHVENESYSQAGSWFNMEWTIPSALLLAGQTVCISGLCRLKGPLNTITVGGRYELGDGRKLIWSDQTVLIPDEFQRWTCTIPCPSVQEEEFSNGHNSRVILKILHHNNPFEFDLTDFQVEIGTSPTNFEYVKIASTHCNIASKGLFAFRKRLHWIWNKTREKSKSLIP